MLQPHSEDGAAGASSRNKYILAGAAAAVLGIVGFLAMPKTGKIAVFVSSGDAALDRFTISIDGQQRCTASPCRLELDRGVHALRATADGFMPYERGITVTGGDAPINISLARGSAGTGLRVGGQQAGVFVVVDGKEVGPLPQELKNLEPGTHKVLFKGTDRYASEEKTVKVSANEIVDLGNVRLKVLRGLATFDVKTPGTKVTLVSGNERRQLMDFSQPVEIDTAKNWQVEATKLGYEEYKSALTFEDGAEKTFPIELREKGNVAVMAQATTVSRQIERPQHTETAAPPPPAPRAESGGGNCTLNINSLPASTLLLDGRPLGSTPKAGVSATAGAHTIVFVHPDHGRKTQTVTCKSGETKTVAARLSE